MSTILAEEDHVTAAQHTVQIPEVIDAPTTQEEATVAFAEEPLMKPVNGDAIAIAHHDEPVFIDEAAHDKSVSGISFDVEKEMFSKHGVVHDIVSDFDNAHDITIPPYSPTDFSLTSKTNEQDKPVIANGHTTTFDISPVVSEEDSATPVEDASPILVDASEATMTEVTTTEAIPTKVIATEATATEVTAIETTATDTVATEATTTETTTTEAISTEAIATEAVAAEAAVADTIATQAIAAEATVTEAIAVEAIPTEATVIQATTTETIETETIAAKATETEAFATEAIVTDATAAEVAATEATAIGDIATEPIAAEAAATEVVATEVTAADATETEISEDIVTLTTVEAPSTETIVEEATSAALTETEAEAEIKAEAEAKIEAEVDAAVAAEAEAVKVEAEAEIEAEAEAEAEATVVAEAEAETKTEVEERVEVEAETGAEEWAQVEAEAEAKVAAEAKVEVETGAEVEAETGIEAQVEDKSDAVEAEAEVVAVETSTEEVALTTSESAVQEESEVVSISEETPEVSATHVEGSLAEAETQAVETITGEFDAPIDNVVSDTEKAPDAVEDATTVGLVLDESDVAAEGQLDHTLSHEEVSVSVETPATHDELVEVPEVEATHAESSYSETADIAVREFEAEHSALHVSEETTAELVPAKTQAPTGIQEMPISTSEPAIIEEPVVSFTTEVVVPAEETLAVSDEPALEVEASHIGTAASEESYTLDEIVDAPEAAAATAVSAIVEPETEVASTAVVDVEETTSAPEQETSAVAPELPTEVSERQVDDAELATEVHTSHVEAALEPELDEAPTYVEQEAVEIPLVQEASEVPAVETHEAQVQDTEVVESVEVPVAPLEIKTAPELKVSEAHAETELETVAPPPASEPEVPAIAETEVFATSTSTADETVIEVQGSADVEPETEVFSEEITEAPTTTQLEVESDDAEITAPALETEPLVSEPEPQVEEVPEETSELAEVSVPAISVVAEEVDVQTSTPEPAFEAVPKDTESLALVGEVVAAEVADETFEQHATEAVPEAFSQVSATADEPVPQFEQSKDIEVTTSASEAKIDVSMSEQHTTETEAVLEEVSEASAAAEPVPQFEESSHVEAITPADSLVSEIETQVEEVSEDSPELVEVSAPATTALVEEVEPQVFASKVVEEAESQVTAPEVIEAQLQLSPSEVETVIETATEPAEALAPVVDVFATEDKVSERSGVPAEVPVEDKTNTAAIDESVVGVVAEPVAELTTETEIIETSIATAESAIVEADEPAVGVEVPAVVESVLESAEVPVPIEAESSVVPDVAEAEPSDLVRAVSPPVADVLNTDVVEVPVEAEIVTVDIKPETSSASDIVVPSSEETGTEHTREVEETAVEVVSPVVDSDEVPIQQTAAELVVAPEEVSLAPAEAITESVAAAENIPAESTDNVAEAPATTKPIVPEIPAVQDLHVISTVISPTEDLPAVAELIQVPNQVVEEAATPICVAEDCAVTHDFSTEAADELQSEAVAVDLANSADEESAASLNVKEPEFERPKSPWTPSYTVTTVGHGSTGDLPDADEEATPSLSITATTDDDDDVKSAEAEDADNAEAPSIFVQDDLKYANDETVITEPEVVPAGNSGSSSWLPSYSVNSQGLHSPVASNDNEVEQVEQLPVISIGDSASIEPPAAESSVSPSIVIDELVADQSAPVEQISENEEITPVETPSPQIKIDLVDLAPAAETEVETPNFVQADVEENVDVSDASALIVDEDSESIADAASDAQPQVEDRRKSQWIPSYSVSLQGSRPSQQETVDDGSEVLVPAAASTGELVAAQELASAEELEVTLKEVDVPTVEPRINVSSPEELSDTLEVALDGPSYTLQDDVDEPVSTNELSTHVADVVERPWTPSYSVSRQGSSPLATPEQLELPEQLIVDTEEASPEESHSPKVVEEPTTYDHSIVELTENDEPDISATAESVTVEAEAGYPSIVLYGVSDQTEISDVTSEDVSVVAETSTIWIPSYSVKSQGSSPVHAPVVTDDTDLANLEALPADGNTNEARKSAWISSYSVSSQGTSPLVAPVVTEDTEVEQFDHLSTAKLDGEEPAVAKEDVVAVIQDEQTLVIETATEDVELISDLHEVIEVEDQPAIKIDDVAETAEADTSALSKDQPERPWTPSYSVHSQGPGTPNAEATVADDATGNRESLTFPSPDGTELKVKPSLARLAPVDETKQVYTKATTEIEGESTPSLAVRARLNSTTSSRFFPGGWFSGSPNHHHGRPSIETASGEFTKRSPDGITPSSAFEVPANTPIGGVEDHKRKGKWCVIM